MRLTFLAAMGVASSLAGLPAHAADPHSDLLPPAPAIDEADEAPESGWYLRGAIGAVQALHGPRNAGAEGLSPSVRSRFERTLTVGAGAGYRIAPWFRADLTLDHRAAATFRGTRFGLPSGAAAERAEVEATTFLANAYLDLPLWSGVTPYLGAGLGVGRSRVGDAERWTVGAGDGRDGLAGLPSRSRTGLAWALMAGAAFDLSDHLTLDLGYRYARLGSGGALQGEDHGAHQWVVGARYRFDQGRGW